MSMVFNTVVVNLIQDLATPHNNVLIGQFKGREDVNINLWYASERNQGRYQWDADISNEHFLANIYGRKLNLSFLWYCLTHTNEKFVIVGWMNTNTRMLYLLYFLLRRPFNYWTDYPNPNPRGMGLKQKLLRRAAYWLLRHSRCKVFGVGKNTLEFFRSMRFPESKLVNLPIFVAVDEDLESLRARRSELQEHYGIRRDGFLVSCGSRLIHDKGYDLLIRAIALLPADIRGTIKVVIVGSGEALPELQRLVTELDLSSCIVFERWLEIEDFKVLIANSDVFVHPARFDAYGGTIFGMALGVPVIGSTGAGAAVDRIIDGCNGLLYEPEDIRSLADGIVKLYRDPDLRHRMGKESRETALKWHPSRGVDILLDNII